MQCGELPMALQVFPLFMDFYLQSLLFLIFACTCLDNQVSFSPVTVPSELEYKQVSLFLSHILIAPWAYLGRELP